MTASELARRAAANKQSVSDYMKSQALKNQQAQVKKAAGVASMTDTELARRAAANKQSVNDYLRDQLKKQASATTMTDAELERRAAANKQSVEGYLVNQVELNKIREQETTPGTVMEGTAIPNKTGGVIFHTDDSGNVVKVTDIATGRTVETIETTTPTPTITPTPTTPEKVINHTPDKTIRPTIEHHAPQTPPPSGQVYKREIVVTKKALGRIPVEKRELASWNQTGSTETLIQKIAKAVKKKPS
jgi:hypothetical protein